MQRQEFKCILVAAWQDFDKYITRIMTFPLTCWKCNNSSSSHFLYIYTYICFVIYTYLCWVMLNIRFSMIDYWMNKSTISHLISHRTTMMLSVHTYWEEQSKTWNTFPSSAHKKETESSRTGKFTKTPFILFWWGVRGNKFLGRIHIWSHAGTNCS